MRVVLHAVLEKVLRVEAVESILGERRTCLERYPLKQNVNLLSLSHITPFCKPVGVLLGQQALSDSVVRKLSNCLFHRLLRALIGGQTKEEHQAVTLWTALQNSAVCAVWC
jgi:hypothetical protein